jgi:hypothetical protein
MRVIPILATGVLLLASIHVAKAADPTLLAETAAYLLGNAYRCGVPDDRIEHAGTVIRDLIVVAARDTAELVAARARFVEIFSAIAAPSQDQDGFPSCKVVIPQFGFGKGNRCWATSTTTAIRTARTGRDPLFGGARTKTV